MKIQFPETTFLALAVLVLAGSGCARSTLSLDQGTKHLSPVLGSESESLQFINHAHFAKLEKDAEKVDSKKLGIVALTASELVLAEGGVSSITEAEVERIPLIQIEGVAVEGPFLQVLHQGYLHVVLPYRWYSDTVDMEQLAKLLELLESLSVPAIAAADVDWVRRTIRNAEGTGIHIVGSARRPGYVYDEHYSTNTGGYIGNQVVDSPGFQPMER